MNRMGAAAGILPGVRIACGTCAECIGNNIWPSPYSLLACQRRLNIIMCPALSTAKRAPNSHAPLFGIHVIRDNAHHMHMELCAPPGPARQWSNTFKLHALYTVAFHTWRRAPTGYVPSAFSIPPSARAFSRAGLPTQHPARLGPKPQLPERAVRPKPEPAFKALPRRDMSRRDLWTMRGRMSTPTRRALRKKSRGATSDLTRQPEGSSG